MVRDFADRPLDPDVTERILQTALRAPSAGFAQGWAFLALTEPADRERFWTFVPNQAKHTPGMRNAPLVVIPMADKSAYLAHYHRPGRVWEHGAEDQWPVPYWFVDTAMATVLMLLAAVDEQLGGFFFWIMPSAAEGFTSETIFGNLAALRTEFGIPDEFAPIGALAIGYRAPNLPPQDPTVSERRRDPSEIIHRGHWGRHR